MILLRSFSWHTQDVSCVGNRLYEVMGRPKDNGITNFSAFFLLCDQHISSLDVDMLRVEASDRMWRESLVHRTCRAIFRSYVLKLEIWEVFKTSAAPHGCDSLIDVFRSFAIGYRLRELTKKICRLKHQLKMKLSLSTAEWKKGVFMGGIFERYS